MKNVHTEHCCIIHGCKYGDRCAVSTGELRQTFPCEECNALASPDLHPVKHEWRPGQIFVFGSNLLGIHGAGAAKFAYEKCGAVLGRGEGLMGSAYALPTCSEPGVPVDITGVQSAVKRFQCFASQHPEYTFFLTRVGCGIAGFTDEQVSPLFQPRMSNILYPPEWY